MKIREVWAENFEFEMELLDFALHSCSVVSVDTEFPGFVRNTPRNACEARRYQDMKFNVDSMKLIQLGLALSDETGSISTAWEFNFSDFDPETDLHVPSSIALLCQSGIDLEKMKKEGVSGAVFSKRFGEILFKHRNRNIRWVTFHGVYDFAYLIKNLTNKAMEESVIGFARVAGEVFGRVYDIKYMALCRGLLGGELGLNKLGKILNVERCGETHQAGSDSLLTACIFLKMKSEYGLNEGMFEGYLYGVTPKIEKNVLILLPAQQYLPMQHRTLYYPLPFYHCPSSFPVTFIM